MDKLSGMLPFLVLAALGSASLVAAIGAWQRRAEELGEERRMLLYELERERRERLEAQERVKQLTREHPHLDLQRELQRLTEELELECEGRTHNQSEGQRLGEELERGRLARSGDQRNIQSLERELRELQQLLEERQQALKAPKKGLWTNLLKSHDH